REFVSLYQRVLDYQTPGSAGDLGQGLLGLGAGRRVRHRLPVGLAGRRQVVHVELGAADDHPGLARLLQALGQRGLGRSLGLALAVLVAQDLGQVQAGLAILGRRRRLAERADGRLDLVTEVVGLAEIGVGLGIGGQQALVQALLDDRGRLGLTTFAVEVGGVEDLVVALLGAQVLGASFLQDRKS